MIHCIRKVKTMWEVLQALIKRIFNLFKGRKLNSEEPQKLESVSEEDDYEYGPEDRHYFYEAWDLNQTYCSALTNSRII